MKNRGKRCIGAVLLVVLVIVLIWWFYPMKILCRIPIANCHLVYQYHSMDEKSTITSIGYRDVEVSQMDTAAIVEELRKQDWTFHEANDWNNHKLILTTSMGISFTVYIQSFDSDKLQLNGVGAWMSRESKERFWHVIRKYITDEYVASGP